MSYPRSIKPLHFTFDSSDAGTLGVTGTSDMPSFAIKPSIEHVVGYTLKSATVPFTYSVTTPISSTAHWSIFNGVTDQISSALIDIGEGTFTLSQIQALWNTEYPELRLVLNQRGQTIMYTTDDSIANTTFSDSALSFATALGFELGTFTTVTTPFIQQDGSVSVSPHIISQNAVALSGPDVMYLRSDFGSVIHEHVRTQFTSEPLIGSWRVNTNFLGQITYDTQDNTVIPISRSALTTIDFSLFVGNNTTPIQLKGKGFQIEIIFWVKDSIENHDIHPRQFDHQPVQKKAIFNNKRQRSQN